VRRGPALRRRALLALAPAALAPPARAQAAPEILARYPNGTFLENLVQRPDGTVLFTSYFARAVETWSQAGGPGRLAEVPMHPVSLTAIGEGRHALVAHGAPFTGGPAAMRGAGAVLVLDAAGAVTRHIALPDAIFPNGGLLLGPDTLLVADSAIGRIWAVALGAGTATPWLDHPGFAPVVGQPYPGVNGIKRGAGGLLLSNSAQRTLLRLPLDGALPAGAPEVIARMTTGIDDFDVAADATVLAATHAEGLALLPPGAAAPRGIPRRGSRAAPRCCSHRAEARCSRSAPVA
jgi:hypothetical protein